MGAEEGRRGTEGRSWCTGHSFQGVMPCACRGHGAVQFATLLRRGCLVASREGDRLRFLAACRQGGDSLARYRRLPRDAPLFAPHCALACFVLSAGPTGTRPELA